LQENFGKAEVPETSLHHSELVGNDQFLTPQPSVSKAGRKSSNRPILDAVREQWSIPFHLLVILPFLD
jgi:hypothetical protein